MGEIVECHRVTTSQEPRSISFFSYTVSFSLWLLYSLLQTFVHVTHVSTSCAILCDRHCTRCGDPQWMWTSRKKRLNTLDRGEKEVLDHTWRGTHWTYVTPWFASRRVRRDVTRFKTCDTLPERDTLTPFTGWQVFRVKRDVIPHTGKLGSFVRKDCSTRWRPWYEIIPRCFNFLNFLFWSLGLFSKICNSIGHVKMITKMMMMMMFKVFCCFEILIV